MGTPTALRKTRAVLTGTSFADNTTGAITAQMVRQFTESGMGGYATICAKGRNTSKSGGSIRSNSNNRIGMQEVPGLMQQMILEPYLQQL